MPREIKIYKEAQHKTLLKLWETNHLLTCLAEECGEVMEAMYLKPNNKEKIEHELNDIIAVAHLLHDKDIVCADLEPNGTPTANDSSHPIFECVKDIQYFSHKAIRFGLLDTKPNSSRRNIDELKYLLHTLTLLMSTGDTFNLWKSHNIKITKVLKYLDYAKRTTLDIHDNMQTSEEF